jgi:hypothetical protein
LATLSSRSLQPADDIAKSKKQAESTAGCKLTSQAKKA